MGKQSDGADSIATVVRPLSHWPTMRCLILVAADTRKKVGSSVGMKRSTETSPFIQMRADKIVPERTEQMVQAIGQRDFSTFAELTMRDSNSFHATCLDTFPPCVYMNQVSHAVVDLVHRINDYLSKEDASGQKYRVAYTFDAGPNACLFLEQEDVPRVLSIVTHYFPPPPSGGPSEYVRGEPVSKLTLTEDIKAKIDMSPMPGGSLKYIISTGIGHGPERISDGHLIDCKTGLPLAKNV